MLSGARVLGDLSKSVGYSCEKKNDNSAPKAFLLKKEASH